MMESFFPISNKFIWEKNIENTQFFDTEYSHISNNKSRKVSPSFRSPC